MAKLYMILSVLGQFLLSMATKHLSDLDSLQTTYFISLPSFINVSLQLIHNRIPMETLDYESHWKCYLRGYEYKVYIKSSRSNQQYTMDHLSQIHSNIISIHNTKYASIGLNHIVQNHIQILNRIYRSDQFHHCLSRNGVSYET